MACRYDYIQVLDHIISDTLACGYDYIQVLRWLVVQTSLYKCHPSCIVQPDLTIVCLIGAVFLGPATIQVSDISRRLAKLISSPLHTLYTSETLSSTWRLTWTLAREVSLCTCTGGHCMVRQTPVSRNVYRRLLT